MCLPIASLIFVAALASNGKFLLAARRYRRATCTDYIISLKRDDMSKGSKSYMGKLRYILTFSCLNLNQMPVLLNLFTSRITPLFCLGQTFWEQNLLCMILSPVKQAVNFQRVGLLG